MAPNFDVPVVGPVPLVQRLENLDLMPAETDASGARSSAIVRTLLDVDTHFWFQDPSKRHAAVRVARSQSGRCARGRWQLLLHQPCRRLHLTTLAMRHALPAVYNGRESLVASSLIGYGTNVAEAYRQLGDGISQRLFGFDSSRRVLQCLPRLCRALPAEPSYKLRPGRLDSR